MKALLDYLPLIIFFYFYKTTDPKDNHHPLLQLVGSDGNTDQNNILVATCALLIATLIVYGCLFIFQKFKLEKQQWFIVASTIIFGGLTLAFSDIDYIKYKAIDQDQWGIRAKKFFDQNLSVEGRLGFGDDYNTYTIGANYRF